ncbi:MAG: ribonuclease E/G, partial [Rhodobacterales bacterium]
MAKKMLIDATHAEETRVVVVDGNKVEEFDFESENKRQLAGNIYLAKVTRVEPSLQAAFVDYGGNRHGFLAFSEIHPDYYQIPVADRQALMEEEQAYADAQRREDDEEKPRGGSSRSRNRSGSRSRSESVQSDDAVVTRETEDQSDSGQISGMETIDLDDDDIAEGTSPMEIVGETPVEEPEEASYDDQDDNDQDDNGDDDDDRGAVETMDRDDSIESVADDDDSEDIRPVRKPRARRYKIQEVIKVRQILLVQVVKEERGNKGAALTTYLSLAGRYCVLMPNTARGGGISRKITNAVDRKKLKEIATEIDVPRGAGLIVRTAGAKRTKTEIKRDYEYLQRLWEQIRELTLKSIAPAKIYEEGDLIKRSIRDLYSREIDEVLVEG